MMAEARVLRKIAKNITVKVPLTPDGLRACRRLTEDGAMVNVTLCFSAAQAILAAKAGATFVSPFIGRLDDVGEHGMGLIADIVHDLPQLLRPSRPRCWSPRCAARCTWSRPPRWAPTSSRVPPAVLRQLFNHPLTDKGLAAFLADWAKTGQQIA